MIAMKKLIVLILALVFCLATFSCAQPKQTGYVGETPKPMTVTTQRPTAASSPTKAPTATANPTSAPQSNTSQKNYIMPSDFRIEGKWKNIGSYTFGQVQAGAIVVFNGSNCNFFSPNDTYALYIEGGSYKLSCTSMLFSQTLTFIVRIIDKDHIDIYNGSEYLEMVRVG